jgi:DNA-binding MarR family transcriptional regulator
VREIHNCVNLEKPRVSRAVARLESVGLVKKMPSEGDGRLVVISLTEEGHAALADILPAAKQVQARLIDGVGRAEIEGFCAVMEKLHAVLDTDPQARPRSRMDLTDH